MGRTDICNTGRSDNNIIDKYKTGRANTSKAGKTDEGNKCWTKVTQAEKT